MRRPSGCSPRPGWSASPGRASTAASGGTLMQQAIVSQELAPRPRARARSTHIGLGMCGPTVIAHGSDDQKDRYLGPAAARRRRLVPAVQRAGVGLATSPRCAPRAVRDGDGWRGQRPEGVDDARARRRLRHPAHPHRPDRPKHAGLTMFVVDMHAPGVTVRPLRQMAGGAGFNEVFFDDVRIPDSERLGEVGRGLAGRAHHADERAGGHRRRRRRPRRPRRGRWPRTPASGSPQLPPSSRCSPGRRSAARSSPRWPPATPATAGFTVLSQGGAARARGQRRQARRHRRRPSWSPTLGVRLLGDDAVYAADRRRRRPLAAHAGLPARPGDRRRHRRDAAQHPRRAGARPAAASRGWTRRAPFAGRPTRRCR